MVLRKRWVVERTLAWFNQRRRLAKDWENLDVKAGASVLLGSIRLMLRTRCRSGDVPTLTLRSMTPDNPLATPDWFPALFDHERKTLAFFQMTRHTLRQLAFHHEAIFRSGNRTLNVPIDKLSRLKPSVPSHFILHTALCGSTLLARYLEDLPRCFVLKEPSLLTQLALVPYSDSWPDWFATSLNLLGRAYPSDAATIIKLHDVCNWMGGLILDHDPRTRIVFLYNPLRTHLLHFLKDQRRRTDVHRHVRRQPWR